MTSQWIENVKSTENHMITRNTSYIQGYATKLQCAVGEVEEVEWEEVLDN